jgi:hypothetical protein
LSALLIWAVAAMACASIRQSAPEATRPGVERRDVPPKAGLAGRGCPQSDRGAASAIRSEDALVRSLLVDACRHSPSLQRLADAIGHTDGVVYVTLGRCPFRALRGCLLHTIEDTGNARYLWIRVGANRDQRELVATMAHELQHALEVLTRADVRNRRDLLDFYRSRESRAYSDTPRASAYRTYETTAAINLAAAVRAELAAVSGAVSDDVPD